MIKKLKRASKGKKSNQPDKTKTPKKKTGKKITLKKISQERKNTGVNSIGMIQGKYNAIIEQASEALLIHDFGGKFVEVNKRACDLLGYTRKELLKMSVFDIEKDFDLKSARAVWEKIKPNDYYTLNGHQKKKDGTVFPVEIRFGVFDINKERYYIGFVRDITDRKKFEEEIVKKEERFRETLDNMLEGCQIINRDWVYIYINDVADRHNKRAKEELLGKKYTDMWPGIEKTEVYKKIKKTLEDRIPNRMENEFVYPDGSIGWFELSIQPVPEGVFILSVDITERKKNEKALILGEKKYRYLFNSNPFPMWVYDLETLKFLDANESSVKQYGYTKVEFLNMTLKDIRPEEDIDALLKDIALTSKVLNNAGVWRHKKKNGEIIYVEIVTHLIDIDGRPARLALSNNVTGKIQAEKKLKESENHFRNLADSGLALIWTSDTNKKRDYFNKPWLEFTGRKLEQELGDGWAEGVHPDDVERCFEFYYTAFDRREKFKMEYRLMHNSGEYKWIIDEGSPRFNSEGEFIEYIGHCIDVTERKQNEEKIFEVNSRFRKLFDKSPYGIVLAGRDFKFIMVNNAFSKITGYTEEELLTKTFKDITYIEDKEKDIPSIMKLMKRELDVYKVEKRYVRKDGKIIWASITITSNFSEDGKFLYNVGVIEDITERKKSEDKLSKLSERLNLATSASQIGIWDWDIIKNEIIWDKKMYELYGLNTGEYKGVYDTWLNGIHPDDRESSNDLSRRALLGEIEYDTEFRLLWPDGSMHWLKANGRVFRDEKGNPIRMVGVNYDITEEKLVKESLIINEERFRQIVETSGVWVWEVDKGGLYTYVSEMEEGIMGFKADELIGKKHFYDFFAPKVREELKKEAFDAFEQKKTFRNFENPNIHKNGNIIYLETSGTPLLDKNGNLIGYRGADRDITERKLAEEKIKNLNEDLEFRVYERTAQLEETNKELEAFSYSVSHDLRSPLRAISGFSKFLLEDYYDKLDDNGKEYINDIIRNANNMASLIDDLLQLSRFGRKTLDKKEIKIKEIFINALKEERKNYDKDVILKIHELPNATGDFSLIKQVIINLVSNAVKFSSKNPAPEIEIGFTKKEKENVYFVKDNGVGFDMKYKEKLFGVFHRLHKEAEFPGTGVGLALVQRIINKHNGRVWAKSEPGKGAVFYFSLPV